MYTRAHTSYIQPKIGLQGKVLEDLATAPGKLPLSFGHLELIVFVGCVSIHVFKWLLCALHTYILCLFRPIGKTRRSISILFLFRLAGMYLSSLFSTNFPRPSVSLFLQDNLRQLIMIPLPNVLLLGKTPYCGRPLLEKL